MRIAVVGGSGFVGRHLVRRLSKRGDEVVTVDRRAPAARCAGEQVVEADLTRPDSAAAAARGAGDLDGVVWLAANIRQSGAVDAAAVEDARVMVQGPLEFLAALARVPRAVVAFSSIEVYGRPRRLPVDEEHPTHPFTAYGAAKLCAEGFLTVWARKHGVPLALPRVAFIYGPGQHTGNVIPRFLEAARRGEPPTIYGPGTDVRDDVFVDDVAAAAELAVVRGAEGVFNVASGHPHTLADVAETVCRVAGLAQAPRHKDMPSHWVDRSYSIDRARAVLGWVPRTSIADGIRAMWEQPS